MSEDSSSRREYSSSIIVIQEKPNKNGAKQSDSVATVVSYSSLEYESTSDKSEYESTYESSVVTEVSNNATSERSVLITSSKAQTERHCDVFYIKHVMPTNSVPTYTPLLLRVNEKKTAKRVKLDGIRLSTPIQTIHKLLAAEKRLATQRLSPSREAVLMCTATLPSFVARKSTTQFVMQADIRCIEAIVRPQTQEIQKNVIPRNTVKPLLMLPPEGPIKCEKAHPLWENVTYTVALGKHIAIPFAIPSVPTKKVHLHKTVKHPIHEVDSATLYRKAKQKRVILWKKETPHALVLSTVEKNDPCNVIYTRVEQGNMVYRKSEKDLSEEETGRILKVKSSSYQTHEMHHRWSA